MKNKLLEAELKKFKMISEYSFYIPDNDEVLEEDDDELDDTANPEGDADPGLEGEVDADLSFDGEEIDPEMGDEMGGDMGAEPVDGEPMEEPAMEDLPEPEGDMNLGDDTEMAEPEGEEEVELDITELVGKSDEAVESSEQANEKISMLMSKFAELEERLPKMDMLGKQLEDLKQDIIKRNPTEVEKLEMRSMNSFPYNIKLSDYWEDKNNTQDNYDTGNGEGRTSNQEKEYVLTQDEVDSDYNERSVRNSFNYKEEDM